MKASPNSMQRRKFLGASLIGTAALGLTRNIEAAPATISVPQLPPGPAGSLRICFFTDAHLPGPHTHEHERGGSISNERLHYQERIRRAFDKANAFKPAAYIFGGDNIFAVDQGNSEDNAKAQFESWKAVVREKVSVPHHSVIGNHDIWSGPTPKAMAMEAYGMPNRYYTWKMGGWKFIMLDVFGEGGSLAENTEQGRWLVAELSKAEDKEPVCIVTHAPMMGLTAQCVGGGVGGLNFRSFFYRFPQVRLALSGHQHMVDCCRIDRVTYICGGSVGGGWWEGDYEHFGPVFLVLDLKPDGTFDHQEIYWEKDQPGPYNEQVFPIEKHKDLYNC